MDELIDRIEVKQNKEIHIHLAYADPYKPLLDCVDEAGEVPNVS